MFISSSSTFLLLRLFLLLLLLFTSTIAMAASHPYYPRDLELEGYVPLVVDFTYILGVFFSAVACIAAVVWKVSSE